MKKILITGKNSYIGTNVKKWLDNYYVVESIDLYGQKWLNIDFSQYDVVFHVAGIAHFSKDPSKKDLYYEINRDLAIKVAQKAKESGIRQFIFMSSIIVYGDSTSHKRVIIESTQPTPTDFYGDSKLQAEIGIRALENDEFKVVIIRPPMIYGKGSKGNYPKLSRLAKKIPIFPQFDNKRSMLHIDNLCEFVKQVIYYEKNGTFFPQNREYVCTSDLVREISAINKNKVIFTKKFNWIIKLLFRFDIVKKLFGNLAYDQKLSDYGFNYQIRTFKESIEITEK